MGRKEAIIICMDNSEWMNRNHYNYGLQLKCVRSYCRAKLKSNPENAIGIVTMGIGCGVCKLLKPTSDLDKILRHLHSIRISGAALLDILEAIDTSLLIFERDYPSNQKRILIFTGGPPIYNVQVSGKWYAEKLKQEGIGVDVVNFCLKDWNIVEYRWRIGKQSGVWKRDINAFVAAVKNNNNHIIHIQPGIRTKTIDVISRCLGNILDP
ncbi:26S proteasome non-ATPase regulatory subunit 4 homolog isoform X2 [Rutidosis leptorrhynchoides]|uniref:26S proteasome non-ATPase regulatory subunit 4 homolog isoform X2 n=2 Tax=Rutidosis leptorrhynchoides TaxID=125765 RepID=UPI003A9A0AE7